MADIISESGLSNGAVLRYFASKEEIVIAVCEQAGDAFRRSSSSRPSTVSWYMSGPWPGRRAMPGW